MRSINIYTIIFITVLLSIFSCATQVPLIENEVTMDGSAQEAAISVPDEQEAQAEEVVEIPSVTMDNEEFQKAETDISKLIADLNAIIASKNFTDWEKHLSNDYIIYYSDPDVLKEKSESPLLKKYNVVLRTIEDYFNFVVVGSRQNVKLDEIKVIDKDRIKAYTYINSTPVIIYELIRIDNTWKIGKF